MIAFQALGGLGNQLFQYAAARRLALRHDCPLVIDPYWFDHPKRGETPRQLELYRYPVKMRSASRWEQLLWTPLRIGRARHLKPLLPLHLLREEGYGLNTEVLTAPANSYLAGYWQSESYFTDIRQELLAELEPIAPPGEIDQEVITKIQSGDAISVHVRRGDYVSLASASSYHGLCTLEYYRKAIDYIAQRVGNPQLFIFSDDPEWTKANLHAPHVTHYVVHNDAENAFQDLRLMSLCKHHILANSSFSWWGAWLSRTIDGIVISPERWYAADRPTPDLIPARWLKMAG